MSVNPEDWVLTSSSKFLPHLFEKRFKKWVVIDRRRGFSQEIQNFTVGQKPQNAVKKTTRLAEIRDVLRRNWTKGSIDKTKEPEPDLDKLLFSIALWPVRFVLMGRTWWEKNLVRNLQTNLLGWEEVCMVGQSWKCAWKGNAGSDYVII